MKYNKFLTLIIPILLFFLLELFFWYPRLLFVVLVFIFLSFFFICRQFLIDSNSREKLYNIIILPSLFTFGSIAFSLFVPNGLIVNFIFVLNVIFIYLYFRSLYYYLIRVKQYKKESLGNISAYGNFMSFYFIASFFYAVQLYLSVDIWKLILLILFIVAVIVYQVIWVNSINKITGLFYIVLSSLVIVEMAWAISFLTLNFYILGLLLAVSYYILIGLIKFYLLGNFNKKIVKLYLIFGFSSIFIVLLTTRWI